MSSKVDMKKASPAAAHKLARKPRPAVPVAKKSALTASSVATVAGKAAMGKQGPMLFKMFVANPTAAAEKVEVIRAGINARVMDGMVAYLDVPKNQIFAVLRTPESSAHTLIKDNRTLDSATTERVMRIADIARFAEETFGGREPATKWLKSENRALAGATPLSMLDTEPGAGEVRRILASINYGGVF